MVHEQRVAAYCVIFDDAGRLLLTGLAEHVKPGGWWTLPGGGVEFGEHPDEAVVREVKEETGYDIVLDGLLAADSESGVRDEGGSRRFHALRYVYRGTIVGGKLGVVDLGGSTTDVGWFDATQLAQLKIVEAVKRALTAARGRPARLRSLDHVQIAIPEGGEPAARAFWVDLMGLVEEPKPPVMAARGGAWFVSPDRNVTVHVGVAPTEIGLRKSHPAFTVDNVDEMATLLGANGYDVRWDTDIPAVRRFHTDDPFGNRIEIIGR